MPTRGSSFSSSFNCSVFDMSMAGGKENPHGDQFSKIFLPRHIVKDERSLPALRIGRFIAADHIDFAVEGMAEDVVRFDDEDLEKQVLESAQRALFFVGN